MEAISATQRFAGKEAAARRRLREACPRRNTGRARSAARMCGAH
jgi:hypothetical protein